jgi:hypothetical protein
MAKDSGDFNKDIIFYRFPHGCCGDISDLLAQYLLDNGIMKYYVCGNYYYDDQTQNAQSHAWLWTEDKTIIDITGDQFKNDSDFLNYDVAVYVGPMDEFHKLFEVEERDVHKNVGLNALGDICQPRLSELYRKIMKYCQ